MQERQHHSLGIAEGDLALSGRERFREIFGHVKSNGNAPENTAGKAHLNANTLVVGPGHESSQRGESSVEEQLQIAELSRA